MDERHFVKVNVHVYEKYIRVRFKCLVKGRDLEVMWRPAFQNTSGFHVQYAWVPHQLGVVESIDKTFNILVHVRKSTGDTENGDFVRSGRLNLDGWGDLGKSVNVEERAFWLVNVRND